MQSRARFHFCFLLQALFSCLVLSFAGIAYAETVTHAQVVAAINASTVTNDSFFRNNATQIANLAMLESGGENGGTGGSSSSDAGGTKSGETTSSSNSDPSKVPSSYEQCEQLIAQDLAEWGARIFVLVNNPAPTDDGASWSFSR